MRCVAAAAYPSAREPVYYQLVADDEVYNHVNLTDSRERVRLRYCPREAVKYITVCAVVPLESVGDYIYYDPVGNKQAFIDIRFSFLAEFCIVFYIRPEYISRGYMGDIKVFRKP